MGGIPSILKRRNVPKTKYQPTLIYNYGKYKNRFLLLLLLKTSPFYPLFFCYRQKRFDGSVDFYRSWSDYVNGFGSISGEYWLGLEKLYRLASSTRTLRVDLTDWSWNSYYAQYNFYSHNSGDRSVYIVFVMLIKLKSIVNKDDDVIGVQSSSYRKYGSVTIVR